MGNFDLNKDKLQEIEEASEGLIDCLSGTVDRLIVKNSVWTIVEGLNDVLKGKSSLGRADIAIVKSLIEEQEKELEEHRKNARKKGVWLHFAETSKNKECWQCSNCKHEITENPKFVNSKTGEDLSFGFCPVCGAPMADEVKEGRKSAKELIELIKKKIRECDYAVYYVTIGWDLYDVILRDLHDDEKIEERIGKPIRFATEGTSIFLIGEPVEIDIDATIKE